MLLAFIGRDLCSGLCPQIGCHNAFPVLELSPKIYQLLYLIQNEHTNFLNIEGTVRQLHASLQRHHSLTLLYLTGTVHTFKNSFPISGTGSGRAIITQTTFLRSPSVFSATVLHLTARPTIFYVVLGFHPAVAKRSKTGSRLCASRNGVRRMYIYSFV